MKIAICDDNEYMLQSICKLLKLAYTENYLSWQTPLCFSNAKELLDNDPFDLIYLDIELPDMSGLEAAVKLRTANRHTQLIFVTAYPNYVFNAFQVMPIDFLVKPINCQHFLETFKRALENYRWQHQTVACQSLEGTLILPVSDICYISSDGRLVQLYLRNGNEYTIHETISHLTARLSIYHIIRCHRSYLVNLAYVQSICNRKSFLPKQRSEGKEVTLSEIDISLPVGKKYLESFRLALLSYQEQGRAMY